MLDLFGEVPVTTQDVDAWVWSVAGIEPGTPRAEYYAEAWRVVDKIKRAKLAGTFEETVGRAAPASPFWWSRFTWTRHSSVLKERRPAS